MGNECDVCDSADDLVNRNSMLGRQRKSIGPRLNPEADQIEKDNEPDSFPEENKMFGTLIAHQSSKYGD